MAGYYYKSPANAEVFINNTQQAYDVQPIKEAVKREIAEKQRLQKESMAQGMKALNRENKGLQLQIMHDSADYHTMIDVNAMNKLPLDQVYQNLTGHEIKEQGSYKMAKGFEPGTSSSRDTLAFIENEDGTQLAHDLKTGNTHNAISMLKEMKGLNVYQSAEFLEKEYRVNLK